MGAVGAVKVVEAVVASTNVIEGVKGLRLSWREVGMQSLHGLSIVLYIKERMLNIYSELLFYLPKI